MKRMLPMFIALSLVMPGFAQEAPKEAESKPAEAAKQNEALEILKKADAATRAVTAVRYTAVAKGGGALAGRQPTVEGTAVFTGINERMPKKFHIEADVTPAAGGQKTKLVMGSDGDTFFVVNPKTNTVHADIDPAVMGRSASVLQNFVMVEFVYPTPFTDEIEGKTQELRGERKIGDEDCYHIYVEYKIGGQKAEWFFSKKDYLPRGVKRIFTTQAQEVAEAELMISKLDANPKIDEAEFKVVVPEGYKKTDEPAP